MCLDALQITRALTLGLDEPHVRECLACRRQLERERATRDALAILPVPVLSAAHRRQLAAELLATADHAPPRRTHWKLAVTAVAIAAAAALIAAWPTTIASDEIAQVLGSTETIEVHATNIVQLEPAPAAIAGSPVQRDDDPPMLQRTRRDAVGMRVVVGSDGSVRRATIERDSMSLQDREATRIALAAFRDGWIALRSGRNREAIALFDRATDPLVIEEATYWAAIAARRSGNATLAAERLARFVEKFPHSEYLAQLRAQ